MSGAATGALAGTGVGIVAIVAGNAVIATAESVANSYIDGDSIEEIVTKATVSGVVGGVAGKIGGAGVKYGLNRSGLMVTNLTYGNSEVIPLSQATVNKLAKTLIFEGIPGDVLVDISSEVVNDITCDTITDNN